MPRSQKQALMKLSEFLPGQFGDCYALLAEKSRGSTRDARPYHTCRFRDASRVVTVRLWNDHPLFKECQEHWQPGQFYKLRGTYVDHERYGPQFEIDNIRPVEERDQAEGFRPHEFLDRSRFDPEQLFRDLLTLIANEVRDGSLKKLIEQLLVENANQLKLLPASTRHAYPFAGGWLERTRNVARTCLLLADYYIQQFPDLQPPLNRDLILAAAVLKEIGRVLSIEPMTAGQPPRTSLAGELFGHPLLSCEVIAVAARTVPELNAELLRLLQHIIVAEPRLPESSVARPARIPEALIVHHATELDQLLEMSVRCLGRDTSDGPFTERDSMLGRSLLKQRTV